jgi:hypothetical protein
MTRTTRDGFGQSVSERPNPIKLGSFYKKRERYLESDRHTHLTTGVGQEGSPRPSVRNVPNVREMDAIPPSWVSRSHPPQSTPKKPNGRLI